MELYSKEELLMELKKEYSCGGECDHCPEVLDAGSCAVLRCIRRIIDHHAPTISIDWGSADGDMTVYARSQGECKSCRHRDPEDKKCDCGRQERQGCPFPVNDNYYCKYYEKGGAE